MERPYEIPYPADYRTPWRERDAERWFAENRTGRKCTVVIDEPIGCMCCVFHSALWSCPDWGGKVVMWYGHAKANTAGVCCSIAKNDIVTVIDRGDREFKPAWCPLVPLEEEEAPC